MDLATILGLSGVVTALIIGVISSGTGLGPLIDIPSVFITVGGGIASNLMANPVSVTLTIPRAFRKIFNVPNFDVKGKIVQIVGFAEKARRDGLLALEDDMDKLEDPFLKKALQLVVDGTDQEIVRSVMEIEMAALEARHGQYRSWFESLAALAPGFGMLGTLIGLIGMLRNMGSGDTSLIGRGMAAALITTFYGSLIQNGFALPTASKLKSLTNQELTVMQIMVEGTLSIQAGDNPRVVQEKLISYLPPDEREGVGKE